MKSYILVIQSYKQITCWHRASLKQILQFLMTLHLLAQLHFSLLFVLFHFHLPPDTDPLITSFSTAIPLAPLSWDDGGPSHSGLVLPKPALNRGGKMGIAWWFQIQCPAPLGERCLAAFLAPLPAALELGYGAGFCLVPLSSMPVSSLAEGLTLCLVPVIKFRGEKGRNDENWQDDRTLLMLWTILKKWWFL